MPQATDIVINDGANTPVARTFSPIGKDAKAVLWYPQTSPVVTGSLTTPIIGIKQSRPPVGAKTGNGKHTFVLTLALPYGEAVGVGDDGLTAPPTLAYTDSVRVSFDISDRTAKLGRKHLRVLTSNALLSPQVIAAIDDLLSQY